MTIDEAITRERQLAKEQRSHIGTWYSKIMGYDDEYIKKCEVCAEEHKQLAEWLEELKEYKKKPEGWLWDEAEQKGYNKAIDDVMNKAKEIQEEQIKNLEQHPKRSGKQWAIYMNTHLGHIQVACKRIIEEQLKAGEENE